MKVFLIGMMGAGKSSIGLILSKKLGWSFFDTDKLIGVESYLEHYDMTIEEFDAVLDKYVNRELFEKKNGRWMPTFTIE